MLYKIEVKTIPLTSEQTKYLLAIYALREGGATRVTALAQRLGVSKSSVHRMPGQLSQRIFARVILTQGNLLAVCFCRSGVPVQLVRRMDIIVAGVQRKLHFYRQRHKKISCAAASYHLV